MGKYFVPAHEYIYELHNEHTPVKVYGSENLDGQTNICQLPADLTVKTKDCWDCNVENDLDDANNKAEIDALLDKPMNPLTGPICFEGVKKGDVLKITVVDIDCGTGCDCAKCTTAKGNLKDSKEADVAKRRFGSVMTIDFEGVCAGIVKERVTRLFELRREGEKTFTNFNGVDVELNPMIGVIGVLPDVAKTDDAKEKIMACHPGDYGGNMDTTLIRNGAVLYLPVQVDGGMLYMGDAHAQMGEGEQYTTGLETSATYTLKVEVLKGDAMKIKTPFIVEGGRLASIYTQHVDKPYIEFEKEEDKFKEKFATEGALEGAMDHFIQFISDHAKTGEKDYNEVGIFCGLFSDLTVSQIADDPYRTARCSADLEVLEKVYGIKASDF